MTVLSAAFLARFSDQRALEWTRPDDPSATTIDTVRLLLACADATADFITFSGVEFDELDVNGWLAQQLPVAVWGVRAYLLMYLDQGAGEKAVNKFHDQLINVGKVTGRDRIQPRTTSLLQPTVEGARGIVRPSFDGPAFNDVNLDNPSDGYDSSPDHNAGMP